MKVKRDYGFTIIPDALLDSKLGHEALLVYCVLARHADKDAQCFPSIKRIAEMTDWSVRKVTTAIKVLEDAGWLSHVRTGRSNLYTIRTICVSDKQSMRNRYAHSAKEGLSNKDDTKKDDIKISDEAVAKKLYNAVKDSFISKNEEECKTWNWGAQGKHIQGLVKKAMTQKDPENWLRILLNTYWNIRESGNGFWRSQPFTPMNLNSEGIMTRVLAEMGKEPVDMREMIREAGLK